MFHLFKPRIHPVSGVLPDDRPPEEKQKDFLTEEVLTAPSPLNWTDWDIWRKKDDNVRMLHDIQVNNQKSVGSCASEASSLVLAINNYLEDGRFIKMSARAIYARRRNKPKRGMYADDVGKIVTTWGTVPESLFPSPHTSEEAMSNLNGWISMFTALGRILKAKNYLWLYQTKDIDTFAQILNLNKPLFLTVIFGDGEFDKTVPVVKAVPIKYGHAITGLPGAYFLYQGKRAILIQNSWSDKLFYSGRQILTEDWFLKGRVMVGMWFEDLNNLAVFNQESKKLPHYQWTRDLYVGKRGADVAMLQTVLSMIKDDNGYLFPLWKGQAPSGWYGGITRSAVRRFQIKYNITPTLGYFGPKTRAKLNEMCK